MMHLKCRFFGRNLPTCTPTCASRFSSTLRELSHSADPLERSQVEVMSPHPSNCRTLRRMSRRHDSSYPCHLSYRDWFMTRTWTDARTSGPYARSSGRGELYSGACEQENRRV